MMNYFTKTLTLLLVVPLGLFAQEDLPLNLNGAYISASEGFNAIKVIRTYEEGDYYSETINHFDDKGLNFLTESYYKGEKQGKVNLFYNNENKLTGFKDYSKWVYSNDSGNDRYWDSTLIAWENEYFYNAKGNIEKGINQWYNDEQKPTYRTEIHYKYDSLNRVTEEIKKWYDLSESQHYIYFEPNSTELSPNQEIQRTSKSKRIYNYSGDTVIIKNYREKEHKTDQIIVTIDKVKTEVLKTPLGDTLRTTTTTYNNENKKIEEVDSGDSEISIFGGYSDGMSYEIRKYDYNASGLLSRITFINSKYNSKMYIDYEYIK